MKLTALDQLIHPLQCQAVTFSPHRHSGEAFVRPQDPFHEDLLFPPRHLYPPLPPPHQTPFRLRGGVAILSGHHHPRRAPQGRRHPRGGPHPLHGHLQPPLPPRAGRGLRRLRLRPLHWPPRRLHRHLRPRGHQPCLRPRRRPPRFRPPRRHHRPGPHSMIGTDAFQETPIVEVSRSITKHNYLVLKVDDIPRIIKEAFFLASSGRPGPVLVDIPNNIQQKLAVPAWDPPLRLPGYIDRLPKPPATQLLQHIIRLVSECRRPVLYVGGGCANSGDELRRFVDLTRIPVASTLMGLGAYPTDGKMLGMHGTVYANYAVDKADLLLAFGVRFDDRVTGKLETFASHAKRRSCTLTLTRPRLGGTSRPILISVPM